MSKQVTKGNHSELRFDGADYIEENEIYGVVLENNGYQIRSAENPNVIRPFKVVNTGAIIENPLGIDTVPMGSISLHIYRIFGIELNEEALTALGLNLDRTASTIKENKGTVAKSNWNVEITTGGPKSPAERYPDATNTLLGRVAKLAEEGVEYR
ncbi:Uncharacterised protein [uncultured archaeon]|nr:Uncharacterised protein [uncultured archaeon]